MKYRRLGNTGLVVSEICLGTMNFGSQVVEKDAVNIIKEAIAAGVNFIDTANSYTEGKSEEIVGKALQGERDSMVVATKAGLPVGPSPSNMGLSRKHIFKAVEDSLRRLGIEYIDLYYAHVPDYNTPIEETLRAMDDLVRQGKVRYIACSNFRAWQLAKALCISALHNLVRFDCISSPYSLLIRDIEYELLALCESEGVGVCVYNPLACGLLTGKYELDKLPTEGRFTLEMLGPMYRDRYWLPANFEAINQLKQFAGKHGCSLAQFSLAWILANKVITSVICGFSSTKQLEENLKTTELEISKEELTACDAVWQQLRPVRFLYGR